ncbi:hypothetical protein H9623_03225 [Oerskovia sp. Sa1BUA8]|uniref:Uncharacterized protein n=1 Tax=Oerskovia douganii TaxID=2762210 RepID=A0A9D5UE75_9CELL|nr:hypothetical protein [Oerskovia douganii]MBE7699317.1 hypothetical protein [Oerskovia douganii]
MPPLYDLAWSVVFLLAPLLVVIGATAAVTLALTRGATRRRAAESATPVAAATVVARARATTTHVAAWVVALLVTPVLLSVGAIASGAHLAPRFADYAPDTDYWMTTWNPVPLAVAPVGITIAYLAVLLVGEATWRAADGTVRRAGLAARSTDLIAPRSLRRATWAWSALLVVAALFGGLTATRTGTLQRSTVSSRPGRENLVELVTATPYPSWEAAVPLAVGALVLVIAVELVLRRVTNRPVIDAVDPAWDMALRRLTARRVLRLPQLLAGLTLCVVLVWIGRSFLTVEEPVTGWVLVALGSAAGLVALVLAVVPGRLLPLVGPDVAPAVEPVTAPRRA